MEKSILPIIESVYDELTSVEKIIANYFLNMESDINKQDFSAKKVSNDIHVSIASLTRFAKKCGFNGYKEFIYEYKKKSPSNKIFNYDMTSRVLQDYSQLLEKTYSLVDEEQFLRIGEMLNKAKNIFIYGKGSSGLVAQEMKFRFMRIGLTCEAITDEHIMKINRIFHTEHVVVIGISVSGETKVVLEAVKHAKNSGAKTVFITGNNAKRFIKFCDELVLIAIKKRLSNGNIISPQFPVLLIVDLFYAFYTKMNNERKAAFFMETLKSLKQGDENNNEYFSC